MVALAQVQVKPIPAGEPVPALFEAVSSPMEASTFSSGRTAELPALSRAQADRFESLARSSKTQWAQVVALPKSLAEYDAFAMGYAPERGLSAERAPTGGVGLTLRRDRVEIVNDDEYAWIGTVEVDGQPSKGRERSARVGSAVLVYREGEGITGSVTVEDERYQILNLSGGRYALVRYSREALSEGEGASPYHDGAAPPKTEHQHEASEHRHEAMPTPSPEPEEMSGEAECQMTASAEQAIGRCGGIEYVRALVLYSPNAAANRDINGAISLMTAEANEAYAQSQIGNMRLTIAHRYATPYNSSGLPAQDIDRIQADYTVRNLRNQYQADVVVWLTNSAGYAGLADAIYATESSAFAVANIEASLSRFTFAHEIGHLQGAQHHPEDRVDANRGFAYGRGHKFEDRDCTLWIFCSTDRYATVMAYPSSDRTRIQRFSNPSVTYDGQATGIANARDNARVLRETAAHVADFRAPNPLGAFIVQVSGSTTTGGYTFTTNPCGGGSSYSYEWYVSSNPTSFEDGAPNSRSRTFTHTFIGTQYLKLVVRSSDGQVVERYREVVGKPPSDDGDLCLVKPWLCGPELPYMTAAEALPEAFVLGEAMPNPAAGRVSIRFELPEAADVRLRVFDTLGREAAAGHAAQYRAGAHQAELDLDGVPSGVYFVRMEAGGFAAATQLIVAR
jgi:hypothetical protein